MPPDWHVSEWITGLAGDYHALDEAMKVLASNNFAPRVAAIVILSLWFGTRAPVRRKGNQKIILGTGIGMIFAFIIAELLDWGQSQWGHFWVRPYENPDLPEARMAMESLYFKLGDSSFPSNAMCGFAPLTVGAWRADRRAGILMTILLVSWGCGRVFVGIHYPLDILGGVVIGLGSAFLGFRIIGRLDPYASRLLVAGRRLYIA